MQAQTSLAQTSLIICWAHKTCSREMRAKDNDRQIHQTQCDLMDTSQIQAGKRTANQALWDSGQMQAEKLQQHLHVAFASLFVIWQYSGIGFESNLPTYDKHILEYQ